MPAPLSLQSLLGPRCFDDADRIRRYEIPERGAPGKASCVLLPESEDEVGSILETASRDGLALVIAAGRTGLVEAQRPDGEAVLSLEKLNRPLELRLADGQRFEFQGKGTADAWRDELAAWFGAGKRDSAGATITAQAGVSVDAVNQILGPLGLFFPMEMGSSSAATVGGCVANGSAGANAVCYGTAAHMAVQAWGRWGNGEPAGPCRSDAWCAPPADCLAINSAAINPAWGLIGSQGVLGVITRVELRTCTLPAQREGVLLPVDSMPEAMKILAAAQTQFPGAVEEFEFISRRAMDLVRELRGAAFRSPLGDLDAPFFVLLQVKSDDADDDLAGRVYSMVSEQLGFADERIGYAPLKDLKAIRHSITEGSNHRMKQLGGGRLAYDTATPVAVFGDYLARLERELASAAPGVEFVAFGHAGVGGAHLHLLGRKDQPVADVATALNRLVFDITAGCGGTFSAEHGVGSKWGEEFWRRANPVQQSQLLDAKRRHDPRNVLNPRCFALHRHLPA